MIRNTSLETLPTFQDSLCPRCTCVHPGSGRLEGSIIPASTMDSTVHNLGELLFLEQLCGFCCFSMRFVVMIDLLSTIIQLSAAYVRVF